MSEFRFLYTGGSMRGVFTQGDALYARTCDFSELRRGDVIAVDRAGERYVHRIIHLSNSFAQTCGDANAMPDSELLSPGDRFFLVYAFSGISGKKHRVLHGTCGMFLFAFNQFRRMFRTFGGSVFGFYENCAFWRISARKYVSFGCESCVYCGKILVARVNSAGQIRYAGFWKRFVFKVPKQEKMVSHETIRA